MNTINQNNTSDNAESSINFDALSQGFDGGNFYGLEYILDDFFDGKSPQKTTAPAQHSSVDWFGLYS
jgi:hypothetical protein